MTLPEAPTTSDDLVIERSVALEYPLEDTAVPQYQDVHLLSPSSSGIDLSSPWPRIPGAMPIVHVRSRPTARRLLFLRTDFRHLPHLNQPLVEADDMTSVSTTRIPSAVASSVAVKQRESLAHLEIGLLPIGDVVTGHHVPTDGGVADQIDEGKLEGRGSMLPWRISDRVTATGPATDAPHDAYSNAPAQDRSIALRNQVGQGKTLQDLGIVSEDRVTAPETDWMHPSGETSMVTAAEL